MIEFIFNIEKLANIEVNNMDNRKAYLNWPSYDDDLVNKAYVDYKLKNIDDDNYRKQLHIYKEYISNISNKEINTYLYSITDDILQKVN